MSLFDRFGSRIAAKRGVFHVALGVIALLFALLALNSSADEIPADEIAADEIPADEPAELSAGL